MKKWDMLTTSKTLNKFLKIMFILNLNIGSLMLKHLSSIYA